ncbi:hypothetical protein ACPV6K_001850 [Campylobacter coli]
MKGKTQIQKLRDYAELSWASYGYFHLETSENNPTFINVKDNKEQENEKEISLTDILDITYKDYKVYIPSRLPTIPPEKVGTLKGDFSPTQAKNFLKKYDILIHQPNIESGFSATLFKDTKADSKDSEYILAIRGTEFKLDQIQDLLNDYYIGTNNNDMSRVVEQYFDMLFFYEETLKPLLQEKSIAKINVTGHSLGGYLTQLFALSYPSIVNEVYTYNASLESKGVA